MIFWKWKLLSEEVEFKWHMIFQRVALPSHDCRLPRALKALHLMLEPSSRQWLCRGCADRELDGNAPERRAALILE